MSKTKEELSQLKQECETLSNKLKQLSDEELDMVTGGIVDNHINHVTRRLGDVQTRVGVIAAGAVVAPLYVVDGVDVGGDLERIKPDDIESIDVLKDAASTAIYGTNENN